MNIQKIKKSDISLNIMESTLNNDIEIESFQIKDSILRDSDQVDSFINMKTILRTRGFDQKEDDFFIFGLFDKNNNFINFIPYETQEDFNNLFEKFRVFLSIFLHNNQEEFPVSDDILNKIEFPKQIEKIDEIESLIFNFIIELNKYKDQFNTKINELDLISYDFKNIFKSIESGFKLKKSKELIFDQLYKIKKETQMNLVAEYKIIHPV